MKRLLFIMLLSLAVACKSENSSVSGNSASFKPTNDFDWLVGSWQRINEEDGKETFENWDKINNYEYHGVGFTLQRNDTIWQESVRLVKVNEGWNFEVTGKGEKIPTIFRLTKIEQDSFVSENQDNEFPKIIRYFKNGKNISAIISGGSMEILFDFERLDTNKK